MFKRAFSYIETVIAIFICLLILIPTIKINLKQIHTYKIAKKYDNNLIFFNSLANYIRAQNFSDTASQNLVFQNYEDLKNNPLFEHFTWIESPNEFNLEVEISTANTNFYLKNYSIILIKMKYRNNKINFSENIIKFKE